MTVYITGGSHGHQPISRPQGGVGGQRRRHTLEDGTPTDAIDQNTSLKYPISNSVSLYTWPFRMQTQVGVGWGGGYDAAASFAQSMCYFFHGLSSVVTQHVAGPQRIGRPWHTETHESIDMRYLANPRQTRPGKIPGL